MRPQDLLRQLAIDEVADAILMRADAHDRGHPGEQRRMAEDLALGQEIDHMPLVDQLDGPGPNDVEELRRLAARLQDDLIGTVELDVGVLDDLCEPFLAQFVERRVDAQEGGDVHGLEYRTGGLLSLSF
jgi:hypothetical protein